MVKPLAGRLGAAESSRRSDASGNRSLLKRPRFMQGDSRRSGSRVGTFVVAVLIVTLLVWAVLPAVAVDIPGRSANPQNILISGLTDDVAAVPGSVAGDQDDRVVDNNNTSDDVPLFLLSELPNPFAHEASLRALFFCGTVLAVGAVSIVVVLERNKHRRRI